MLISLKGRTRLSVLMILALTLGVGCGASVSSTVKDSSDKFPPSNIRLGPMITVTDMPVEKVSATMDNVGRTHLFVAMKSPKQVEYVAADPDSGAALPYTSEIMEFRVQATQTFSHGWDIVGQVRLVLRGREKEHILSGSRTERTNKMPGEEIIQGVMEDSLRKAVDQLAAIEGDL